MKTLLIDAGRDSVEIEVSGNPVFDNLASFSVKDHSFSFRKRKGWGEKFVILWVKSVAPIFKNIEFDIESLLLSEFGSNQSVQVVFRPHPNELSDYSSDEQTGVYVSDSDDHIHSLIAASDLVVTINSTVGIEANLLGKPVIQVDMFEYESKIPFTLLQIGSAVSSLEELLTEIEILIAGASNQVAIQPCIQVGTSSKKIVDCIEREFFHS